MLMMTKTIGEPPPDGMVMADDEVEDEFIEVEGVPVGAGVTLGDVVGVVMPPVGVTEVPFVRGKGVGFAPPPRTPPRILVTGETTGPSPPRPSRLVTGGMTPLVTIPPTPPSKLVTGDTTGTPVPPRPPTMLVTGETTGTFETIGTPMPLPMLNKANKEIA